MAGLTTALLVGGASLAGAAISSSASKKAASTAAAATDAAAQLQNQQFQQLLALQMPGYNRAEGAANIYSQALGLSRPSSTAPAAQTYGGQPSMTSGGYAAQIPQQGRYSDGEDLAVSPQSRLMTGSYTSGTNRVPPPQTVADGGAQPQSGGGQLDIAQQVMQTPGYQTQLDQGLKSIDRAAPLVGGMYSGRRMKALNDYGQQTFGSYYNDWMNRVGGVAGQGTQITQNIGQAGQTNANNVGNLMMTGANARAQGSLNSASAWSGALGNMAGMAGGYWG